ncbi:hypothetical protein OSB04_008155 [Centaurea solstitialis]|uniref:Fe2OG dioxygenase domain-containing protein n=1 Tax=Centaurea solstitialis TaxID=347529 RepID=A0AA38TL87_9ASTR|nr:hypothetical protein OSB04_008155 [Centaurea solstitialis]
MEESSDPPFVEFYKNLFDTEGASNKNDDIGAFEDVEEWEVPLIDLSRLHQGGWEGAECKREIAEASQKWGFFQVINHGISSDILEKMRCEQMKVFKKTFHEKADNHRNLNFPAGSYRWGTPSATCLRQLAWSEAFHVPLTDISNMGALTSLSSGNLDLRPVLDISTRKPARFEGICTKQTQIDKVTSWKGQWIVSWLPGFELRDEHAAISRSWACHIVGCPLFADTLRTTTMDQFATMVSEVAENLAEILAEQLGHKSDFFKENCWPSTCYLRMNRYPPCPVSSQVFGLMPHTDSDFLTILHQDQIGGLQLVKDGKWIAVKPNKEALIINIGDLFQAWSNDVYKSVEHRVVANKQTERFSTAYFFCPSYDTMIQSCFENSIYRRFSFREFRQQVQDDVKRLGHKIGLPSYNMSNGHKCFDVKFHVKYVGLIGLTKKAWSHQNLTFLENHI